MHADTAVTVSIATMYDFDMKSFFPIHFWVPDDSVVRQNEMSVIFVGMQS